MLAVNKNMKPTVKEFFNELEKYELEGTNSMDWAEYAGEWIDEDIVVKLTLEDWKEIKETYHKRSDNFKTLLAGHIHLADLNLADIQLEILTRMILTEKVDVALEALGQITFGFVTSGSNYKTGEEFIRKELKGIFTSKEREHFIAKFFNNEFIQKARQIALKYGGYWKNEIYKFIEVIHEQNTFASKS